MIARHKATVALLVWTGLIWTTRIANISRSGESAWRLVLPGVFTVFGVAAAVALWRRGDARVLSAFAVFTLVFWLVRIVQIAIADHSAAFVAVHAVLGVISMALAVLATREHERAELSPAAHPG